VAGEKKRPQPKPGPSSKLIQRTIRLAVELKTQCGGPSGSAVKLQLYLTAPLEVLSGLSHHPSS
jgi:hypothetical protein